MKIDLLNVIFWVGLGLLMVFIAAIFVLQGTRYESLLQQCMKDGRPEYECVGILRGHSR